MHGVKRTVKEPKQRAENRPAGAHPQEPNKDMLLRGTENPVQERLFLYQI